MAETIAQFILTNAYWFSLPLIGYAILLFFSRLQRLPLPARRLLKLLINQHIFIVFFLSFVAFCVIAAPIILLFYVIAAPIKLVVIGYVVVLCASLLYLSFFVGKSLFSVTAWNPFLLRGQWNIVKYTLVILLIMLAGDFIIATYLRAYALFDVDTHYHMTRIMAALAEGRFSIASGYFSGVSDSSYHANFIYSLYIIPSRIFDFEPLTVWSHSFGFFRLIQWMAIFTLGYTLIHRWVARDRTVFWASLVTILAIPVYSYFYFIATYPNQVVIAWIIAFIIALITYARKPNTYGLVALLLISLLITTTHPTYSLMVAVFTVFWYIVHLFLYQRHAVKEFVKSTWKFVAVTAVLMVGPIITRLMPSHMTEGQNNLGSPQTIDFLFMSMQYPQRILPQYPYQWVILLLSVVGFLYLLRRWGWRNKPEASIFIALASFVFVIFFIPPVFTLFRAILPIWVIERFTAMNVLQFILPFIGILVLALGIGWVAARRFKLSFEKRDRIVCTLSLSLALLLGGLIAPYTYGQLIFTKNWNHYAYEYLESTRDGLKEVIPKDARILADNRISYDLPAILPVNVIAVSMGHSTMAADTKNRLACQAEMYKTFEYQDLLYTGVDYIIISQFDSNIKEIEKGIADRGYMAHIATVNDLKVYKFEKDRHKDNVTVTGVYPACSEYPRIEAN